MEEKFRATDFTTNEFDPIEVLPPFSNLDKIVLKMLDDPTKVQPIKVIGSELTHEVIAEFYMGLVSKDDELFVQLEGFNKAWYQEQIRQYIITSPLWTVVQPGIFRLKIR